ncbi:MAG TPA: indole-3-glycerol phosphate synthase TrpC [Solirubrobacteraceae bacterium]|jgi:indole-3-glycerol phosphate synthase
MSASRSNVLERILGETRAEVHRRKREEPLALDDAENPEQPVASGERPFRDALTAPGIGVIAEFKRRSPSAGTLRSDADLAAIVTSYRDGGAAALSILTEGPNFAGALADLQTARAACGLPLLRKDFIVDPYQLHESRRAGADAILLIVAALSAAELASLHAGARSLGLDVLVEVHDREELQTALAIGADIVGVNNRDLRDFSVDVSRTERLMADVPAGTTIVSESGIGSADQLERLQDLGVEAVLVGETLMRAGDPAAALRKLTSFRHTGQDI